MSIPTRPPRPATTEVWCAPFRRPRATLAAAVAAHAVIAVVGYTAWTAVTGMPDTSEAGEWAPAALAATNDDDVEGVAGDRH